MLSFYNFISHQKFFFIFILLLQIPATFLFSIFSGYAVVQRRFVRFTIEYVAGLLANNLIYWLIVNYWLEMPVSALVMMVIFKILINKLTVFHLGVGTINPSCSDPYIFILPQVTRCEYHVPDLSEEHNLPLSGINLWLFSTLWTGLLYSLLPTYTLNIYSYKTVTAIRKYTK